MNTILPILLFLLTPLFAAGYAKAPTEVSAFKKLPASLDEIEAALPKGMSLTHSTKLDEYHFFAGAEGRVYDQTQRGTRIIVAREQDVLQYRIKIPSHAFGASPLGFDPFFRAMIFGAYSDATGKPLTGTKKTLIRRVSNVANRLLAKYKDDPEEVHEEEINGLVILAVRTMDVLQMWLNLNAKDKEYMVGVTVLPAPTWAAIKSSGKHPYLYR